MKEAALLLRFWDVLVLSPALMATKCGAQEPGSFCGRNKLNFLPHQPVFDPPFLPASLPSLGGRFLPVSTPLRAGGEHLIRAPLNLPSLLLLSIPLERFPFSRLL